jgi:LAS superfamily LD-carboxypeptidase LdcB
MSANPRYKNSAATLALLNTANATLETSIQNAMSGGAGTVAARTAAENEVLRLLKILAGDVQALSDADVVNGVQIIEEAGFRATIQASRGKQTEGAKPGAHSCELDLTLPVLEPGATYRIQLSLDEKKTWNDALETKHTKVTLQNLPLHTTIYWRYCAIGANNRRTDWSEPKAYFVV